MEKENNIKKQFEKGLQEYNITLKEVNENFKYIGGDSCVDRDGYDLFLKGEILQRRLYFPIPNRRHFNYWLLCNPNTELPEKKNSCVCGHSIMENCYIESKIDGEIFVLGNCCIKRFVNSSGRSCEVCGKPHKNRKNNKCSECRVGNCKFCGEICSDKYNSCYDCYFKNYNKY